MANKTHHTCGVCDSTVTDNPTYQVKEWLFATGETFPYFQCPQCGCLQLAEVPADMSKYYPSDYYSFNNSSEDDRAEARMIRGRMEGKSSWRSKMIGLTEGCEPFMWLSPGLCDFDSRILDVGCGDGALLHRMRQAGFKHLTGIDPFMNDDSVGEREGVHLLREDISHHEGHYDLIMMHHSFEHMTDNPLHVIRRAVSLLNEGGKLLICIPVADSWGWEKRREKWMSIDAPRHIFLHTRTSIGYLAAAAGLRIDRMIRDSISTIQFRAPRKGGGETTRLRLPGMQWYLPGTGKLMQWWHAPRTRRLNRTGRSDLASFILKKATA